MCEAPRVRVIGSLHGYLSADPITLALGVSASPTSWERFRGAATAPPSTSPHRKYLPASEMFGNLRDRRVAHRPARTRQRGA
jgi:hypothetical protein